MRPRVGWRGDRPRPGSLGVKLPPRPGPFAQALGRLQAWTYEHGVRAARLAIGVAYFWIGALRFDPTASASEGYLPGRIVSALTRGALDWQQGAEILAYWECLIGFCLVAGVAVRFATLLMFAHALLMFVPLALWPRQIWSAFPFGLTIRGQIVLDNLVMVSCAMVLGASVPRRRAAGGFGAVGRWLGALDRRAVSWMGRHGIFCLRISMGVLYLWFGAIKFLPDDSAVSQRLADLMGAALRDASGGLLPPAVGLPALGALECLIGAGLLAGRLPRLLLALIPVQLLLTATPLLFEAGRVWADFPLVLTLPGKFLVRHLALYGAAVVIANSVALRAHGWSAGINPFSGRISRGAAEARTPPG